jgi:hypothetical protein
MWIGVIKLTCPYQNDENDMNGQLAEKNVVKGMTSCQHAKILFAL